MAPRTKIQDETELKRWFAEGKTYREMQQIYLDEYHIQISTGALSNFRAKHGLERRITRDTELIPWAVKREHRWAYAAEMLRAEARSRRGAELPAKAASRLRVWKEQLEAENAVVHYDPDTEHGFYYVPRREGVDTDLIRAPENYRKGLRNRDEE